MNNENPSHVDRLEIRLLELAAAGDRDARRELFDRYRTAAFRVAMRITGRNADALDVVQDSFIRAFERLGSFKGEAEFKTWLLRIVSNASLDLLRKRRVRMAVSLDRPRGEDDPAMAIADRGGPAPGEALEAGELNERLQAAIDGLPPDQKSVFSMFALQELTYGQIAEALGIPIGTVMSRLYHARRRLHERLADLAPRGFKGGQSKPGGKSKE